MTVTSWIGAGLWTASAVMVAGYTWDSYKTTFTSFPDGGTTVPPPKATQQADTRAGVPNLDRNKNFTAQTSGIAASPITPGTTGTQGIVNWLANAGTHAQNLLNSLGIG